MYLSDRQSIWQILYESLKKIAQARNKPVQIENCVTLRAAHN